jgi:hypothetical protein
MVGALLFSLLTSHSFSYVERIAGLFFLRQALILNHVVFILFLRIAFKGSGKEDSKTH